MIRWTGLAPLDFEFSFPGNLTSSFLAVKHTCSNFCAPNSLDLNVFPDEVNLVSTHLVPQPGRLRASVKSPSSSSLLLSSLELSDTQVYEPQLRARLGAASHFCEVVVLM